MSELGDVGRLLFLSGSCGNETVFRIRRLHSTPRLDSEPFGRKSRVNLSAPLNGQEGNDGTGKFNCSNQDLV